MTGGAGDDSIYGDLADGPAGNDVLSGGAGKDRVQGDDGRDKVSGGSGSDQLLGANGVGPDHERDVVDCGPGKDGRAWVGPEDKVRRCEKLKEQ